MTDLVKKDEQSFALSRGKLVSKQSSFKQRVEASKSEAIDPQTMPNRLCLMLDTSGSMSTEEKDSKSRLDLLKEAVQNFVSRCDLQNTAIAVKTFPGSEATKLSSQTGFLIAYTLGLTHGGGTPLRQCVETALEEVPMTRGVIVSDGGATDWRNSADRDDEFVLDLKPEGDTLLAKYKDLNIPLDCVHISSGSDGEDLLKRIAKATGGIFMKFTDVSAFSKAFGYLTPSYRAMLTSGSVSASDLGAREIK
jgi:Mg-chelatase subunit ChlD